MGTLSPYPADLIEQEGEEPVFTVPAGDYWLGDPGYVIEDHAWQELISGAYDFGRHLAALFPDGKHMVALNTLYGDGIYETNQDSVFDLSVDAGLIGLVPAELVNAKANTSMLGARVSLTSPIEVFNDAGTLHFGEILVYTAPDD